jgi:hypothetical protein
MSKTPAWATPELLQELGQTIYDAVTEFVPYRDEWHDLYQEHQVTYIRAANAVLNKLYKVIEPASITPQVCRDIEG